MQKVGPSTAWYQISSLPPTHYPKANPQPNCHDGTSLAKLRWNFIAPHCTCSPHFKIIWRVELQWKLWPSTHMMGWTRRHWGPGNWETLGDTPHAKCGKFCEGHNAVRGHSHMTSTLEGGPQDMTTVIWIDLLYRWKNFCLQSDCVSPTQANFA